ncbi:MAG: DUF4190 domain-containing protein [bacterium]|nr:DUF4190 domain-containing protein [bacterium]
MKCKNHAEVDAVARCSGCQETFCENCLVELDGKKYCGDCKIMAVREAPVVEDHSRQVPCDEASTSLKYALIGLLCFGFILGPMAISNGVEAKKRMKEDPNLTGDGKATAGIIIGALEFVFWLLAIIARFQGDGI